MPIQNCHNCGQIIGNLQEPFSFQGNVVCKACKILLEDESQAIGAIDRNAETKMDKKGHNADIESKAMQDVEELAQLKNESQEQTRDAPSPKGRVLLILAWILIILHVLGVIGILLDGGYAQDHVIQDFLNEPSESTLAWMIGHLVGVNLLAIAAFFLSLIVWRFQKNVSGKRAAVVAMILMLAPLLEFLPIRDVTHSREDARTALETVREIANIWDAVNRGETISSSSVDGEKYGQFSPLIQLLMDWLADVQSDFQNMTVEMSKCGIGSLLTPKTITDRLKLSQAQESLQALESILDKYEKRVNHRLEEFPERLFQLDVPPDLRQISLDGYNKNKKHALRTIGVFFGIQRASIAEYKKVLSFMELKQNQVRLIDGQLIFDSPADADRYNEHVRNITGLAQEEAAWVKDIREQSLFNAEKFKTLSYDSFHESASRVHTSRKHNFKVEFPAEHEVYDYGTLTHYASEIEAEGAYNIFVKTLDQEFSGETTRVFLEGNLQGRLVVGGDSVRLIKSEEATFRGHKALSYEYSATTEDGRAFFRGIFFNVGRLSYNISTVCPAEAKSVVYNKYDKFLESFSLLDR